MFSVWASALVLGSVLGSESVKAWVSASASALGSESVKAWVSASALVLGLAWACPR
jgi:hypothetical protein